MGWKEFFTGKPRSAHSPEKGPPPAAKEIYAPGPPTAEVVAAREVLTRFWTSGSQGVEESGYPMLLAAARSEPIVLEGIISRLYQDEIRRAVSMGSAKKEQYATARSLAVLQAQRHGFTGEEIERVLGQVAE